MTESKTIISSFVWKFLERGAAQVFSLIVQIVLARLLAPEDFGVLAVLLVFINLSNVLIQKGFATALVQKNHIEDIDINTIFWISELIAAFLYIFLWCFAPMIENVYGTLHLASYLRIISISLFAGAFYSIENSLLIRSMLFKKMFLSSFAATLIAGTLAMVFAYKGMGCWALIWQNIIQQVLLSLFSFPFCRWKIKIQCSKKSFYEVFRFGSNVLLAELLYTGVENLRTLIIGARYSSVDLAYYDRGQTYPSVAMRSIYDTVGSVLLPIFSRKQNNTIGLRQSAQKAIGFSFFLIAPCFIGFAAIAEPFTRLLLTDKWLPCVPYMRLFCVYQLGILPYCVLRNILYAMGKSKRSLFLEIFKSIFSLGAVVIGMLFNPFTIALFSTLAVWLATIAYGVAIHKFLHFDLKELLIDFLQIVICCATMTVVILIVDSLISTLIFKIVAEIITGVFVYVALSVLTHSKYYTEGFNVAMRAIKRMRGENIE